MNEWMRRLNWDGIGDEGEGGTLDLETEVAGAGLLEGLVTDYDEPAALLGLEEFWIELPNPDWRKGRFERFIYKFGIHWVGLDGAETVRLRKNHELFAWYLAYIVFVTF